MGTKAFKHYAILIQASCQIHSMGHSITHVPIMFDSFLPDK